jgi:REP element-mobilizing transposase RayT
MNRKARRHRACNPGEETMPEPRAYFLTWTTYGTWLPGDERGWVRKGRGFQLPNPCLARWTEQQLREPPCSLDREQRDLVERTIRRHCDLRRWELFAVNARTMHVHAVIASKCAPKVIREQLKSWCTRELNKLGISRRNERRENWWSEKGSIRWIEDEESLEAVIHYVLFGQ